MLNVKYVLHNILMDVNNVMYTGFANDLALTKTPVSDLGRQID